MCIAAAIAGGAVLGLAGSAIQGSAAKSAASTQAGAAENAQQISMNEFNTITGQEQPFMQAGYGSLSQLDYLLGIGPNGAQGATQGGAGSMTNHGMAGGNQGMTPGGQMLYGQGGTPGAAQGASGQASAGTIQGGYGSLLTPFNTSNWQQLSPAYNFQLQQGQQGTLNADASNSGALSGAAQKDLIGFNQGLANTSFNNAFNQYNVQQGNIYSRLAGIAQLGQAAASNTGQQGTALAGQAAQSATNVGTALAGGQVGAANAYAGALGNASYLPWLYGGGGSGGGYSSINDSSNYSAGLNPGSEAGNYWGPG